MLARVGIWGGRRRWQNSCGWDTARGCPQFLNSVFCIVPSWQHFSVKVPWLSILTHLGVHLRHVSSGLGGESGASWATVSSSSLDDTFWSAAIWNHKHTSHNAMLWSRWYYNPIPPLALQDSSIPEQGEKGPRARFSHGQVLFWNSMNVARFSFAPAVLRKEQPGQTGQATLLIPTFSSQKIHVTSWLCSGFSFPFMARLCISEAVASSGLPLVGDTVLFLSGYQSCFLCVKLTYAWRQKSPWCPGDVNCCLGWSVPFCGTCVTERRAGWAQIQTRETEEPLCAEEWDFKSGRGKENNSMFAVDIR